MTIAELIEELSNYDPSLEVWTVDHVERTSSTVRRVMPAVDGSPTVDLVLGI